MQAAEIAAQRGRWRSYFERNLGGSAEVLDAAADAAMYAIANGGGQEEATAAGRAVYARRQAPRQTQASTPAAEAKAPARIWPKNSAVVYGFERRQESLDGHFFQVWSCRLLRLVDGKPTQPPIPVEIRGRVIVGQLVQGDVVEIPPGRPGHTRIVKVLRNLSTDSVIEAKGRPFRRTRTVTRSARLFFKIVTTLAALAILAVIALAVVFVLNGEGSVSLP